MIELPDKNILPKQFEYPNRNLIPFARRNNNDEIACFAIGSNDEVKIIHDFILSGYE